MPAKKTTRTTAAPARPAARPAAARAPRARRATPAKSAAAPATTPEISAQAPPPNAAPRRTVTREDIQVRAYFLALENAGKGGSLDYWLAAERELLQGARE